MTTNTLDIRYGMKEMANPELAEIQGGIAPLVIGGLILAGLFLFPTRLDSPGVDYTDDGGWDWGDDDWGWDWEQDSDPNGDDSQQLSPTVTTQT